MAFTLLLSICTFIATSTLSIMQVSNAVHNEDIKSAVRKLSSKIRTMINNDRNSLNKVLSLASANNQTALMQYLQQNPVLSKTIDELKSDTELIASIQAEQSTLENELAQAQADLASLGYNTDLIHQTRETPEFLSKSQEYQNLADKYHNLSAKVEKTNFSTARKIVPYTADIDARSQNINGGINNNGKK